MDCTIVYYSEIVQTDILNMPDTFAARYIVLTRRMAALGSNLGEPHTSDKTPPRECRIAAARMKEVKHANA